VLGSRHISNTDKARVVTALDRREPGALILARIYLTHPIYAAHPAHALKLSGLDLTPLAPPLPWSVPSNLPVRQREWQFLQAVAPGALGVVVRALPLRPWGFLRKQGRM
jgi:hypothetical protein